MLYAIFDDDLISAWEADKKGVYYCKECFSPVKVRRTRRTIPHFYHLQTTPSCRLYSKSEDHLVLQLEIQKKFPKGVIEVEKVILPIYRIADLVWEEKKIVFEIQCSQISEPEARARTHQYKEAGYSVVWILDDRLFNKRKLRPAEAFLRSRPSLFATYRRHADSQFYDQFEIFHDKKRLKRGRKHPVHLPEAVPLEMTKAPEGIPKLLAERLAHTKWAFKGDLMDKIASSSNNPIVYDILKSWHDLEISLAEERKMAAKKAFLEKWLIGPYRIFLSALLKRTV